MTNQDHNDNAFKIRPYDANKSVSPTFFNENTFCHTSPSGSQRISSRDEIHITETPKSEEA